MRPFPVTCQRTYFLRMRVYGAFTLFNIVAVVTHCEYEIEDQVVTATNWHSHHINYYSTRSCTLWKFPNYPPRPEIITCEFSNQHLARSEQLTLGYK